ncbi:MAG: hypothetical protein KAI91_05545 [Candidatus Omnitrophica bacterium]|nr:hypothetical protein [Candidatus Omnitrophota bacterium]
MNPQVDLLNKSATIKITALTKKIIKKNKDVVIFTAGDFDFDTPATSCISYITQRAALVALND